MKEEAVDEAELQQAARELGICLCGIGNTPERRAQVCDLCEPDPENSCPNCGCTDRPIRLRGIVLPVCPGCDSPVRPERREP